MEGLIDDILRLSADATAPVDEAWMQGALAEHPYCTLPLLLYLERAGTAGHEELLSRLAIAWPDRRVLAMRLGEGVDAFKDFYPTPEGDATPDTDTTIDRFLDTYGHSSDKELEVLSQAIFNPTPDYADVLAAQEREQGGTTASSAEGDDQDALINNFIAQRAEQERQVAAAPAQPHVEEQEKAEIAHVAIDEPTATDESMFSESLAKLYIKRHKYSQALEIIKNISLKYPEKSIYFADQIRFLKKLVLIETAKQQ